MDSESSVPVDLDTTCSCNLSDGNWSPGLHKSVITRLLFSIFASKDIVISISCCVKNIDMPNKSCQLTPEFDQERRSLTTAVICGSWTSQSAESGLAAIDWAPVCCRSFISSR
jgi:hypothetical protein